MNTYLSKNQDAFLEKCREFVSTHVKPVSRELDGDAARAREILSEIGRQGFLGLTLPSEYGGQEQPFLNLILFVEAVAEQDPGLALSMASHLTVAELLSTFGTDTQKSRYLPLLARAECIGSLALAEENAGSDFKSVVMKVSGEADRLTVTGTKTWVVNGEIANLAIVSGRPQNNGENNGITLCLCDLVPGKAVKVSVNKEKLGLRSARTNDIAFDGHRAEFLGGERLLLDDGDTEKRFRRALDAGKVVLAAAALGILRRAQEESVERARSREQFGAPIGKLQAIQWKLADLSADSAAARLITLRAAWAKDEAPDEFHQFAAMSKYYAARVARLHSGEAVQIFGALGISADEPIEKMYRDAKVLEICQETSEIQKNIIAREMGAHI